MTRRDVALVVTLTTLTLWLWWATRQDGGWRVVLATAGLWWLAALQATWRVWLPAVVVLAGLALAVPPRSVRHAAADGDGTGDGSLLRHPRASLGRVPPASVVGVPPPPLPYPQSGIGEGVGHGTTDGRGEPPRRNARTGTQHPQWQGVVVVPGEGETGEDERPGPRSLPGRSPPPDTGVTAKRERSAAVKRAGGGWQARRDAQAAQVLAAFRELGAGAEGGYVDKAAVGQQLGLDTKTVHNRCSDLRAKGLLENPEPGKWRAAVAAMPAVAEPVDGMTKYHAVRASYAGEEHDSTGEAECARRLDELKAAGAIRDWRRGRVWTLIDGPTRRDRLTLRPDFEVWRSDGSFYVLDFKGVITREFAVKAKVWKAVYPTVPLYVVKADGREVRV